MASQVNYEFAEKVPEDSICTICTDVLTEPVIVDCCGILFCEDCLKKWLRRQKTCPHCRKENFDFIKDLRMNRMINNLLIYCPNRSKGCEEIITVGERSTHLETCLFEEVSCTNDCGTSVIRKELQNHIANECPKRKINCQYCNKEGMYEEIISENHTGKCPSLPLDCPNNCGHDKIQRKDLSDHQKECPLEPVKCPFFEAGCKQEIPRKELATHEASNTENHLELTIRVATNARCQMKAITCTATSTQDRLEKLSAKAHVTQKNLKAVLDMSYDCQDKLEHVSVKFDHLVPHLKLATIASKPQNKIAIKTVLEAINEMLEQDKQYSLPLFIEKDEHLTRSISFFIQPGYKMYISFNADDNTYALNFEKGEYDDRLKWPMPDAEIQLTNIENNFFCKTTICKNCGHTINRVEKTDQVVVMDAPSDCNPGDFILITIKEHVYCELPNF